MSVTQIVSSSPQPVSSRRCAIVCAQALLALAVPAAQATLVDGSFDLLNPLTTIAAVINTPNPMPLGQWGQESATKVGPVGLVVPLSAPFMLSTTATGGVTSQTVQAFSVGSGAGGTFTLSANYNAELNGPIGGMAMQFFSGNTYATQIGAPVFGSVTVNDSNPGNWQPLSISGSIPAAALFMMAQVYYTNASLVTANGALQAGYVDNAGVTITAVPEPGSWAMLAAGGALLGWRLRQRTVRSA